MTRTSVNVDRNVAKVGGIIFNCEFYYNIITSMFCKMSKFLRPNTRRKEHLNYWAVDSESDGLLVLRHRNRQKQHSLNLRLIFTGTVRLAVPNGFVAWHSYTPPSRIALTGNVKMDPCADNSPLGNWGTGSTRLHDTIGSGSPVTLHWSRTNPCMFSSTGAEIL